jgi:hypothetical protein
MSVIGNYESAARVVGEYFEDKAMEIFNLYRADSKHGRKIFGSGRIPDLIPFPGQEPFFMEIKGAFMYNGTVIKKAQLDTFDEIKEITRFYTMCFHDIKENMKKKYPIKRHLFQALDSSRKSMFVFPYSVVHSYYYCEKIPEKKYRSGKELRILKQMSERNARQLFWKQNIWHDIGLDSKNYKTIKLDGSDGIAHLMTKKENQGMGHLEEEIIEQFQPQKLDSTWMQHAAKT